MEKNIAPHSPDTNKKEIYLLLKIVKNNSNIKLLKREGLTFAKIANLISDLILAGYLIDINKSISLSPKGIEKFEELHQRFKKVNKEEWIEEDKKNKIAQFDKNAIFVPRQDELDFK